LAYGNCAVFATSSHDHQTTVNAVTLAHWWALDPFLIHKSTEIWLQIDIYMAVDWEKEVSILQNFEWYKNSL
jgi:hypothetical protein